MKKAGRILNRGTRNLEYRTEEQGILNFEVFVGRGAFDERNEVECRSRFVIRNSLFDILRFGISNRRTRNAEFRSILRNAEVVEYWMKGIMLNVEIDSLFVIPCSIFYGWEYRIAEQGRLNIEVF
jgi:hypothetical protein